MMRTAKVRPDDAVYADIVRSQADAQPFQYPSGLIEVPMSPVSDVTAFRSHFWKLDWFLKAIQLAVAEAIRTGGVFDFLAHPSCLVIEDPKFEIVKLICGLVKDAGSTNIRLLSIIGCPEGVEVVHRDHPDVAITVAGMDERLNERAYIVPGLGDAGDRIYGTR